MNDEKKNEMLEEASKLKGSHNENWLQFHMQIFYQAFNNYNTKMKKRKLVSNIRFTSWCA